MRSLKKIIGQYMQLITWLFMMVLLIIIVIIQIIIEHSRAYESSIRTFTQMEQVLQENQQELLDIQAEYESTCLNNAETIARIVEADPSVLNDLEELKQIAKITAVDEIHFFDKTGRIYAGTHPEYYDLTMDSGEQIGFFKPLLTDYNLKLVQDISPNTAEEKLMQYSAIWSEHNEFIVQVGMEPTNVMKVTEKNELSYIFSLFRVNSDIDYYAIDASTGTIVGASSLAYVGRNSEELGLSLDKISNSPKGFHDEIAGVHSYCVFRQIGSNYIGRVVSSAQLYQRIPITTLAFAICLALIAMVLSHVVTYYMDKYVVGGIRQINEKLVFIANGNPNETIELKSCSEFAELSQYINMLLKSLLSNNRKMSYVLSKTNMYIGIYEYHTDIKRVRFSEYTPQILMLKDNQIERYTENSTLFNDYIQKLREHPLDEEPGIYVLPGETEHYVRIEEIVEHDNVFGVVIDVTAEITKLKKVEEERDIDPLTKLYNRRGFEIQFENLFHSPEQLGVAALVMIDADGLKQINDAYGHEMGDVYLQKIANIINNFGIKGCLSARYGGDEFLLLLYEYDDEDELNNTLKTLYYIQEHSSAYLGKDLRVPLRFSMGYSLATPSSEFQALLKEADTKMYEDKRERKAKLANSSNENA